MVLVDDKKSDFMRQDNFLMSSLSLYFTNMLIEVVAQKEIYNEVGFGYKSY